MTDQKKKKQQPRSSTTTEVDYVAAEQVAMERLCFTTLEETAVSTWLTAQWTEHQSSKVTVFSMLYYRAPKRKWEVGIDVAFDQTNVEGRYETYERQDVAQLISLDTMLALLDDPLANDYDRRLAQYLDYLNQQRGAEKRYSYLIIKQAVKATRDPYVVWQATAKPDSDRVWAIVASAFGHRLHYELDEYRLVLSLVLTRQDRWQNPPRRKHRHQQPPTPVVPSSPTLFRATPPATPLIPPNLTPPISASERSHSRVSSSTGTFIFPLPLVPEKDKGGTQAGSGSSSESDSDSDGTSKEPLPTEKQKEDEVERLSRSQSSQKDRPAPTPASPPPPLPSRSGLSPVHQRQGSSSVIGWSGSGSGKGGGPPAMRSVASSSSLSSSKK